MRRLTGIPALTSAVVCMFAALTLPLGVSTAAAATGPMLVVVAHPDDEALGAAGVIASARAAGRRVYVAIVTNGDLPTGGTASGFCGAPDGSPAAHAQYGLRRDGETESGMGLLGLSWTTDPATTDIFFLGYPDGSLSAVAAASVPFTGDPSGLHRTYATDGDGSNVTCNGDLRFLLSGHHSQLTAAELTGDIDSLIALTQPSDVFTHSVYDGHPDHSVVARQVLSAIGRSTLTVTVHSMLIHPEGTTAASVSPSGSGPIHR